jgi:hypothetical protein
MVYIRPSAPVIAPTAIKPLAESSHAPEEHSLAADTVVNEHLARPQVERRKQDRRQQRKDALLETRAGRDRRKSSPSISVSI